MMIFPHTVCRLECASTPQLRDACTGTVLHEQFIKYYVADVDVFMKTFLLTNLNNN